MELAGNGGLPIESTPSLFSRDFVGCVHGAVESGRLSVGRAAKLLGFSLRQFTDLCQSYHLKLSYEL